MPTPTPPIYLVREQLDAICRSKTFDDQDLLRRLLRFIVEQTIAEMKTTEGILATEIWQENALEKTKVRANVGRLRKALTAYYQSEDALTAIVIISIPSAGLDENTRQFKHYSANVEFHPGMLRSATTFAQVLFNKYGLRLAEGERWFIEGTEPVKLLRAVIRQHKASALLLRDLHDCPHFEMREKVFNKIVAFYNMADNILKATTLEGITNRNIQVELAVPYAAEIIHSADTLACRYVEWVSGRLANPSEAEAEYLGALTAISTAFKRFLDKAEVKLLPDDDTPSSEVRR